MRPLLFAALFLVACSSASESPATAAGDASSESSSECVNPVEGAGCTAAATICPETYECCSVAWSCVEGRWVKPHECLCIGDAFAPDADEPDAADTGPFGCGSASCTSGEMCRAQAPGIPDGGTSYSCTALPAGCEGTPTCACVKAKIGASCVVSACSVDAQGHVTVSCMGA